MRQPRQRRSTIYHCYISRTAGPSLILSESVIRGRAKTALGGIRESESVISSSSLLSLLASSLLASSLSTEAKSEEAVIRTRQHDSDCDSLSGQVVMIQWAFFFRFLSLFFLSSSSSLAFRESLDDLIWSRLWEYYRVRSSWALFSDFFIHYFIPEWNLEADDGAKCREDEQTLVVGYSILKLVKKKCSRVLPCASSCVLLVILPKGAEGVGGGGWCVHQPHDMMSLFLGIL